jgi:FKBP-type peptidyl-prolyl cis-trans isomerase
MLMSRFVAVLALAALSAGAAAQAQQSAPQKPAATDEGGFANETEKGSYALGYDLAKSAQNGRFEVVLEPFIAGFRDAFSGRPGRMTAEEAMVLSRAVQNAGARRLKAEKMALAAKNRAAGNAFLEENKKRPGVVTLPSGLQYEVLRPGDGPKPAPDDPIRVHFRGTLLDGTVFDTSEGRAEAPLLTAGDGFKGWNEALPMMPVGSKWKLFVPADLGYGDDIRAANIPPGATLIFEVDLLSIEPKPKAAEAPRPDSNEKQ